MARYIDAELIEKHINREEHHTPDERWRPESEFAALIDSIPTADVVEVVHGYWIDAYPEIEPNPMFAYGICSMCGCEQSISNKLAYCMDCGAKMDGKKVE